MSQYCLLVVRELTCRHHDADMRSACKLTSRSRWILGPQDQIPAWKPCQLDRDINPTQLPDLAIAK